MLQNKNIFEHFVTSHPAWRGKDISFYKKNLLQTKRPFCYLLGLSDEGNQFVVYWVQSNGTIMHSQFGYNTKTSTWVYRNGTPHECKSFEGLLANMFHCSTGDLRPC